MSARYRVWVVALTAWLWSGERAAADDPQVSTPSPARPMEFDVIDLLELSIDRPPARLAAKLRRSRCLPVTDPSALTLTGLADYTGGASLYLEHGRDEQAQWLLLRTPVQPVPALCGVLIEAQEQDRSRVWIYGLPASVLDEAERALLRGRLLCECERLTLLGMDRAEP